MSKSAPFRLNRSGLLLALISAAFAGPAGAAAGRVDFTSGNVSVSGTDGRERPLTRGAELDNGDTVRTTADGRAQIRFTDGAYVSLQPNTEFAIKDYRYEGKTDGSERGLFALARGAMRTVTGFIGRINRNRYRITTPTATVGIRGTGGVIQVLNDGSTLVIGTSGIWSLTNPSGSVDVPAGVSGLAPADPNQPPQQTSQAPEAGPPPIPVQLVFTQGGERTPTGDPVIFTPLVTGSGYTTVIASDLFPNLHVGSNTTAVFNSAGQMTGVNFDPNYQSTSGVPEYFLQSGFHAEFGTDGILAWGRWTGAVGVPCEGPCTFTYAADQGVHYVVGMPTPVLPTSGTATYLASTAAGTATSPTYLFGGTGIGSFTGRLDVSFGSRSTINGTFNVTMPAGVVYDWTSTASPNGSLFSMSTSTVSGCSNCSASVEGFFAGPSAERAGVGYHINDVDGKRAIIGAAAFQKQ